MADIVDRGRGTPLMLIPGIQGRWEYMRPAVDALAAHFRVITFSLAGERTAVTGRPGTPGFDDFVGQAGQVLDTCGVATAIVCGVSFGGLIALRFAAARPDRTLALALVSTPGPGWHLRRRHEVYARLPWIFGPAFLAETPWRLRDELRASLPDPVERRRFRRSQLRTFLQAPVSVSRMAERARLIAKADAARACREVTCPTLVLTGEPALDHVIATRDASPYATLIDGAKAVVLPRTGHLGLVTRPDAFAQLVKTFADNSVSGHRSQRLNAQAGTAHDAA